jgi:trehalose 6-phosphate phosphatase
MAVTRTGSTHAGLVDQAARLAAHAKTVALCLDFDGTLAPIVDDPDRAEPLPGIVDLLAQLAARFAVVSLVSGRPAAYLAAHAGAPGVRYLGLYGLQEIRDGQVWVDPRLAQRRPAVVAAERDLAASTAIEASGAYLEDKQYAVGVHTRRVADRGRWSTPIDRTVRQIADRHGLEIIPGKLVWELRPAVPSDKGDAVRKVVADAGARGAAVAGDDLGDLPAFAAAARLTVRSGVGLRVAVRSPEAPAALLAAADLIVDGPPGLRDFLQRLTADRESGR